MSAMKLANSKANERSSGMSEVNMTPLIDVSLVLVVILLLATPLAFESSFTVRREAATARKAAVDAASGQIELTIVSADSVRVNRNIVARARLQAVLTPLLEDDVAGSVAVTCEDSISHGVFVDVLDVARLSGAREIAIAGR
jgi:biopolymer transport protein ExbD